MADKKLLVCNLAKKKSQDKKEQRMSQRLGRFTEAVLDQQKNAEKQTGKKSQVGQSSVHCAVGQEQKVDFSSRG